MPERIDYDDRGNLEISVSNVQLFQLEYMTDNRVWMRLHRDDGPDIVTRHRDMALVSPKNYWDHREDLARILDFAGTDKLRTQGSIMSHDRSVPHPLTAFLL